ncbi:TetR/AcrR family transcriptional regulator [Enterococcus asini]|uniref:TetR/AcrR family transcriptional regulator n=1 Tax=Enterococcus asini TaxID=57732 RepID=UPI00288E6339|nr:TetR/AcrR family transcriptional regulator [Enterococcus asini]MDT2756327.1 TetR/AcrR family transcriptional regulator [Enterococcus asini]
MPKETFFHLSKEKQQRIMKAAKKEFSRAPLGEASIAQIIKDAEIPRGSFYQYFEDKEDLYFYYFKSMHRNSREELRIAMEQANGNLFDGFELYFSKMVTDIIQGPDGAFYQNLFMHMDYRSFHKVAPPFGRHPGHSVQQHKMQAEEWQAFYDSVDLSTLKLNNQEELKTLVKLLMHVVFSTVADGYRQLQVEDKELDVSKFESEFRLKLNWLKNGATKETIDQNEQGKEG